MTQEVTQVEKAYCTIRQDILSGRLEPLKPLRIAQLKCQYSIGASPLREALSRLLTDGLVTKEGNRGFRVGPTSLDDFRDITNVRKYLECHALQLSIAHGDQDWEGKLVLAHFHLSKAERARSVEANELERLGRNFHFALIDGCGSEYLRGFCMHLYDLSGRYRQISLRGNSDRLREINQEHTEIFEATMDRDAERAIALLRDHIEGTYLSVSPALSA